MLFDTRTKRLYTKEGKLLKKLHCPLKKEWEELIALPGEQSRLCEACSNKVVDTSFYSEQELSTLLQAKPDTCLKVDLRQENIRFL